MPSVHQDFEKISEFFKANYKVELAEKDMCVKGWNWGTAKFSGKGLTKMLGTEGVELRSFQIIRLVFTSVKNTLKMCFIFVPS